MIRCAANLLGCLGSNMMSAVERRKAARIHKLLVHVGVSFTFILLKTVYFSTERRIQRKVNWFSSNARLFFICLVIHSCRNLYNVLHLLPYPTTTCCRRSKTFHWEGTQRQELLYSYIGSYIYTQANQLCHVEVIVHYYGSAYDTLNVSCIYTTNVQYGISCIPHCLFYILCYMKKYHISLQFHKVF